MGDARKVKGGGYAGQYHLPVGPYTCKTCAHGYDHKPGVRQYHTPDMMRCGLTRRVEKKRATFFPQDAKCCKRHSFLEADDAS